MAGVKMHELWTDPGFLERIKNGPGAAAAGVGSAQSGTAMKGVLRGLQMLQSIKVEPTDKIIAAGERMKFFATGTDLMHQTRLLRDDEVEWECRGEPADSIDKSGVLLASNRAGVATIIAKDAKHPGTGVQGTAKVTVKEAHLLMIKVVPVDPKINSEKPVAYGGGHMDFKVSTVVENFQGAQEYKNAPLPKDAKVLWKSSDQKVAVIDQRGHATIQGIGKTTITAVYNGVSGAILLTVAPPGPGAQKIDVEIELNDEEDHPISGKGIAIFRAKNCKDVRVEAEIKGGYFHIKPTIIPDGHLEFHAINKEFSAAGGKKYKVRSSGRMVFEAKRAAGEISEQVEAGQENKQTDSTETTITKTTGERTTNEVEGKVSGKANVGVDIGIDIGGETSYEVGGKRSKETSEENSVGTSVGQSREKTTSRRNQTEKTKPMGLKGLKIEQTQ